jgi:hypothetical protein
LKIQRDDLKAFVASALASWYASRPPIVEISASSRASSAFEEPADAHASRCATSAWKEETSFLATLREVTGLTIFDGLFPAGTSRFIELRPI